MTTAAATSTDSLGPELDISEEFIEENRHDLRLIIHK